MLDNLRLAWCRGHYCLCGGFGGVVVVTAVDVDDAAETDGCIEG